MAARPGVDETVILTNAAALFLPWFIGAVTAALTALPAVLSRRRRRTLTGVPRVGWLTVWGALALTAGLLRRNWTGLAAALLLIALIIFGLYSACFMSDSLREKFLPLTAALSMAAMAAAAVETLRTHGRASSVFFNPNFYGYACEMVCLVCAYALLTRMRRKWLWLAAAAANLTGILLAGCFIALAGVAAGLLVLFFCRRRFRLFGTELGITVVYAVAVFFNRRLLPLPPDTRLNLTLRVLIWKKAFQIFLDHPLLGEGALGFRFISPGLPMEMRAHAHDILLDALLNFGCAGVLALLLFILPAIAALARGCRRRPAGALALGVLAATLIHGLIDVPYASPQTMALLFLLLSTAGGPPESVEIPARVRFATARRRKKLRP